MAVSLPARVADASIDAVQRAAYWPMPIARAVPAAGLALVITFSADHSARFGLITFGVFGIIAGLVLGAVAWLRLAGSRVRPYFLTQAAVTLVAGLGAVLVSSGHSSRKVRRRRALRGGVTHLADRGS